MHGLLYAMNILNISLVYMLNHMYETHSREKCRLQSQLITLLHSEFYHKEFVLKHKDRTIQQIREEADAKEREMHVISTYDSAVRVIQRAWRQKQSKEMGLVPAERNHNFHLGVKTRKIIATQKRQVKRENKSKVEAVGKLKATHGNTGKFLVNESMKQTENLFTELLHMFVFKNEGFTFDAEEIMN